MIAKLLDQVSSDKMKRDISNAHLAKTIKKSSSSITQYFNGSTVIPFNEFITLLSEVYEGKEEAFLRRSLLNKYCLSDQVQTGSVKAMMEWCANSGHIDTMKRLVEKFENNISLKAILDVYKWLIKRIEGRYDPEEFYEFLEGARKSKNDHELNALLDISRYIAYIDLGGYEVVLDNMTEKTRKEIERVSNPYTKGSLELRLADVKANVEIKQGNLKEVWRIIRKVELNYNVEDYPIPFASLFCQLSESNISADKGLAYKYIEKSVDIFIDGHFPEHIRKQQEIVATHDFIKIFHGDYNELVNNSVPERAMVLAITGKSQESLALLTQLEKRQGSLSPFQLFTKAIAEKDITLAKTAIIKLRKKHNHFYADLLSSRIDKWIPQYYSKTK